MRCEPDVPPPTYSLLGPALLGWLGGTGLHLQRADLPGPGMTLGLCAGAFFALTVVLRHQSTTPCPWQGSHRVAALLALLLALLAEGSTSLRALAYQRTALAPALEDQDLDLRGRIAALPQPQGEGWRLLVVVEDARHGDRRISVPYRISLSWSPRAGGGRKFPPPQAGDRCVWRVHLRAPHGLRNPHAFDTELWMWEQGLGATATVRQGRHDPEPRCFGDSGRHPIERWRQSVRDDITGRADAAGQEDGGQRRALGTVAALVTGDQQSIPDADWTLYRATGVAHLMSISGLHITLFAWLAHHVLSWLWRRHGALCLWAAAPRAAGWGGLALATLYAVFSGWGVPAQRTVVMLGLATVLRLGGRRWPALSIWLMAGALVSLIDPWALLQPGFWLSFVAVGVLMTSTAVDDPRLLARTRLRRAADALGRMVREQGRITFALAPLTLVFFGQFSLPGLCANLVAIPWVTMVVTPLAFLGALVPTAWDGAALATGWLLRGLEWLARWPLPPWQMPQVPGLIGAAAVVGGWLTMARAPPSLRLLGAGLVLPFLLWRPAAPRHGAFELLGADVGQGQAVLVRTAHHTLLYDSGPAQGARTDAGQRVLLPLLAAFSLTLYRLVISHRDNDHTGGARAVLAAFPHADLLATLEDGHPLWEHPRGQRCRAGQRWTWDGVTFDVLHPLDEPATVHDHSNAGTCVLRVSNGQQTALLAGDLEAPQEQSLLANPSALRADWLLVPHHGSRTSSTPAFLEAVGPRLALVQSGYRNRYGHPAPDVMARYQALGVDVRTSPACGAAGWSSEHPGAWHCERIDHRRYWHHAPTRAEP